MTPLSELFPDGSSGGLRRGARIAFLASTTLAVADHEALAPAGYKLWGWDVICIGGGASGARYWGGTGGAREQRFVPRAEVGATVAITVGAGGVAVSNNVGVHGGDSAFGASLAACGGGAGVSIGNVDGNFPARQSSRAAIETAPNGPTLAFMSVLMGSAGFNGSAIVPTVVLDGCRGGGGGCGANQVGGSVWPHPSALIAIRASGAGFPAPDGGLGNISASHLNMIRVRADPAVAGPGNPNPAVGAPGHPGVGDYPGGGGNGSTVVGSTAGDGGFPGGGGGGVNSNSVSNIHGKGGDGVVIVYPIFEPA